MAHFNVLECPLLAKVILSKVENLLRQYFPVSLVKLPQWVLVQ